VLSGYLNVKCQTLWLRHQEVLLQRLDSSPCDKWQFFFWLKTVLRRAVQAEHLRWWWKAALSNTNEQNEYGDIFFSIHRFSDKITASIFYAFIYMYFFHANILLNEIYFFHWVSGIILLTVLFFSSLFLMEFCKLLQMNRYQVLLCS